ncbi:glutathione S-transferase family protein [Maricurvus nonylphenolicus]|uniref:glutathione S-transferase family protein n=1 Tax=Maricurvus nonylphenolicus TaxID=1008307 RepID=UPI0036F2D531
MEKWIKLTSLSGDPLTSDMSKSAGLCIPALSIPLFAQAIKHIPTHRIVTGLLFHPDKRRPLIFLAAKLLSAHRFLRIPKVSKLVMDSRHAMTKHLLNLEGQLQGSPWLAGRSYSLADLTWACTLLRLEETGWLEYYCKELELVAIPKYYDRLKREKNWYPAIDSVQSPTIIKATKALKYALENDKRLSSLLYS